METQEDFSQLLAKVALKDRRAFRTLYDRMAPKLLGVAMGLLKARSDAELVVEEAFVHLWRSVALQRPAQSAPAPCLVAVTRKLALDRRRGVRPGSGGAEIFAVEGPAEPPEGWGVEDCARLRSCYDALGAEQRASIKACYLDGWSYREAAAHLGAPLDSVKSWIRSGLISLRDCIETRK